MTLALVSGAIANKHHNGGATWTRLSWALGLKQLGFEVCFVEQIDPDSCVDAAGAVAPFEASINLAYFRDVMRQFGLAENCSLLYDGGRQTYGLTLEELQERAASCALLLNISGHLAVESLLARARRKVYIDLDPGFTQFWHAVGNSGPRLQGHDYYFTVGENIGTDACPIPTNDIRWRRTRQPVVLKQWPVQAATAGERFTTVASWRGPYGSVTHEGTTYGVKLHEFRKFIDLPERVPVTFEMALDIHPDEVRDLEALRRYGWRLVRPQAVAADPEAFRQYVQASIAEFSVAQGVYVGTGSGWFSDRTVRYLASGKPALVQDTGWSRHYPSGKGLVGFNTAAEAAAGAKRIMADYDGHCRAARAVAEQYFDSDRVLGELISEIGIAP